MIPLHFKLSRVKYVQKCNFKELQKQFFPIYNKIKEYEDGSFTTPHWKNLNKKLEKAFLPHPPFSFLQNPFIAQTMFIKGKSWFKEELPYLENNLEKKQLENFLQEEYAGKADIFNAAYLTSQNTIHHLYHFIKFQQTAGVNFNNCKTVVEWGGGYGNMAIWQDYFLN